MATGELADFDPEAECAALGSAMLDPDAIPDVLSLRTDDFGDLRNRVVFEAIAALDTKGSNVDCVSVASELRANGQLDRAGGSSRIGDLPGFVTTIRTLPHHLEVIRKHARRRSALLQLARVSHDLKTCHLDDVDGVLDGARRSLDGGSGATTCEGIESLARQVLIDAESARNGTDLLQRRLLTGLATLDEMTQGFAPGALVLIAARPSMGKSALATSIAARVAAHGNAVLFVSLEVKRVAVARSMIAADARIDTYRLRAGDLAAPEWEDAHAAACRISGLRVFVDDDPETTVARLRAKAKRHAARFGMQLLIVDYLQLLRLPRAETREREVASASRELKLLAQELSIPIVVLCQLNRAVEGRDEKMPRLSDLRESGALEQDADVVLLLYRPAYYNPIARRDEARVRVAKNREGPTGEIELRFTPECVRFDDRLGNSGGNVIGRTS